MSLLDTLTSSFGNSPQGGAQSGLIAAAMKFVNNRSGGLNGLIQRFHENGAGDIISSWVGNGENKPISSDTVTNVLGSDALSQIAQKAGLSGDQVSGMLATVLPHLVNHATPDGQVPANGQLDVGSLLGSLGGLGGLAGLFARVKNRRPKRSRPGLLY